MGTTVSGFGLLRSGALYTVLRECERHWYRMSSPTTKRWRKSHCKSPARNRWDSKLISTNEHRLLHHLRRQGDNTQFKGRGCAEYHDGWRQIGTSMTQAEAEAASPRQRPSTSTPHHSAAATESEQRLRFGLFPRQLSVAEHVQKRRQVWLQHHPTTSAPPSSRRPPGVLTNPHQLSRGAACHTPLSRQSPHLDASMSVPRGWSSSRGRSPCTETQLANWWRSAGLGEELACVSPLSPSPMTSLLLETPKPKGFSETMDSEDVEDLLEWSRNLSIQTLMPQQLHLN